jgi:hypothetical protein
MITEPVQYICCVCGARLPHLSKSLMVNIGCAIKRNDEQYVYFCIGRHTKEEIAAAITGVPRFKLASDIKKGLI